MSWETLESVNHPGETAAEAATIQLRRVSETNGTYVSWLQEYSGDASPQLLNFTTRALQQNLADLRSGLEEGKQLPEPKKKKKKKKKKKGKKKKGKK